ncbi:MAG: hypothetical protein LBQ98_01205 [Nitrososphaerota archaeon]|nr:hypothetical protein [Nitrososphaerota archaeon]
MTFMSPLSTNFAFLSCPDYNAIFFGSQAFTHRVSMPSSVNKPLEQSIT